MRHRLAVGAVDAGFSFVTPETLTTEELEELLAECRRNLAGREARFREAHHLHKKESPDDTGNPFLELAHLADDRLVALRRLSELLRKMPVPACALPGGPRHGLRLPQAVSLDEPEYMAPLNAEIREYAEAFRDACREDGEDFSGIHPEYLETLLLQKKGMLENIFS